MTSKSLIKFWQTSFIEYELISVVEADKGIEHIVDMLNLFGYLRNLTRLLGAYIIVFISECFSFYIIHKLSSTCLGIRRLFLMNTVANSAAYVLTRGLCLACGCVV